MNVVLLSAKIELSYRVRPTLTPERSPRLRVERPAIVHSDQPTLDNIHTDTRPTTLHTENQKDFHHNNININNNNNNNDKIIVILITIIQTKK